MAKRKRKLYISRGNKKVKEQKELIMELKELFLRDATEMSARGLYHQALASLPFVGGHIDKDTALVVRIKDIILRLEKGA